MYSNRVAAIKDEIDIDWQLIAADLDTSVNTMRYLHKNAEYDALKCEQFDALVNDIENVEGIECSSYDDNLVLYKFLGEAVMVYTLSGDKYVIFDTTIAKMIESKMNNYKLNE